MSLVADHDLTADEVDPMCNWATAAMLEEPACDLCGSAQRVTLYKLADWRFARPTPEYGVCRCRDCRFVYLSPRPTPAAIGQHYPSGYDEMRGAIRESAVRRYRAQMAFIGAGPGKLLDIGSAAGEFLDFAAREAWDVMGLDPHSRRVSLDARVKRIDVHDSTLVAQSFDLITAWHVAEHVHSPQRLFRRVAELLKQGGRFCLSVPNFDSYWAKWLRCEDVPRHLSFFTLGTLTRFAELAGLRLRKHSFAEAFANGAVGRGAFTRALYCRLGGMSTYEHHRLMSDPARSFRAEFPLLGQIARPLNWIERRMLSPRRLERTGRMGVIAAEFCKA